MSRRDDHYSRDRHSSKTSHTSHSRHGDDRRDGNRRSFGNMKNRGDDRREKDRRAFDDSRKFGRNDRQDNNRRNFNSGHQGRRGNTSYGSNRGSGGGSDRRTFDRRGGNRQSGGGGNNSFDRRRSDGGNRDSGRRFDRNNSSRGSIGTRRNLPQSPRRRNDTDRMPPPRRGGGVRNNRSHLGGNDRNSGINRAPRRVPSSVAHRTSDDKTAQTRRRLAEKHVGRKYVNTGRDILAKKLRMAKLRSNLTTRKRTSMPVRRIKSAIKKPEKKKEEKRDSANKEKEIKSEDADKKTASDAESAAEDEEKDEEESTEKTPKKVEKKKSTAAPIKVNINLECIQCKSKCLTVKEYVVHLHGRAHDRAMQRIALRQRAQISRLRLQQRNAQKEIDEQLGDIRSNYCGTCMLRHRQSRTEHASSEDHRSIHKFLRPYCSICKLRFNRPMAFEQHRCSIEHLRRKAFIEKTGKTSEECEVDLDNFTTVDEVGEEDDEPTEPEKVETEPTLEHAISDDEVEIANEEEINVGAEHIQTVQTHYCSLCYSYISHKGDVEVNLKRHCARSQHLRFYIQYKDDLLLKEEAEALHKKREAEKKKREKEATEKKAKEEAEKAAKEAEDKENGEEGTEEAGEAKEKEVTEAQVKEELNGTKTDETEIWETLNKDIGELIGEDEDVNDDDRLNSEKENGVKENGTAEIKSEDAEKTEKA